MMKSKYPIQRMITAGKDEYGIFFQIDEDIKESLENPERRVFFHVENFGDNRYSIEELTIIGMKVHIPVDKVRDIPEEGVEYAVKVDVI